MGKPEIIIESKEPIEFPNTCLRCGRQTRRHIRILPKLDTPDSRFLEKVGLFSGTFLGIAGAFAETVSFISRKRIRIPLCGLCQFIRAALVIYSILGTLLIIPLTSYTALLFVEKGDQNETLFIIAIVIVILAQLLGLAAYNIYLTPVRVIQTQDKLIYFVSSGHYSRRC